ncbi:MAG: DnaJ domain-containing protein [Anaerolineae bacterium]|nr:DnaJ domain-containing protein [Anaerolineae bacterium]
MEYKDYYKILEVDRNASEKDIKRAYRRLARKYHPDVNPGDKDAEQRFKEINEAHEVLSDAEKRKKYDQFGSQWREYERAGINPEDLFRQYAGGAGGPGGARVRYARPEEVEDILNGFGGGSGFSSFFETLFGQGASGGSSPFGRGAGPGVQMRMAGEDYEQPVEITLEEVFNGTMRVVQKGNRRIEVKIPAGVKTGSRVRVAGEGGQGMNQGPAGDLYLVIEVAPHSLFERDGDDLSVKVPVDLYTAVLGGEVMVPTIKGTRLALKVPAGAQPGQRIRLRGQGMPTLRQADQRGDLFAVLQVETPRNLSSRERELFEELRSLRG